jgi:hypothetical protein
MKVSVSGVGAITALPAIDDIVAAFEARDYRWSSITQSWGMASRS